MPKILKTVSAEKIYSFRAYERFVASGKYFGEYNSLADNGEIFIIRGDSESKEWFAWRCHSPQVADKSDFKKMLMGYEPTGDVSDTFKTKKALTTALDADTAGFKPWDEPPYDFVRCGQIKTARRSTADDDSAVKLPSWIWYLAAAVVVAVGIAILAG